MLKLVCSFTTGIVPTYSSFSVTVTLLNSGISEGEIAPAMLSWAAVTTSSARIPNSTPCNALVPRKASGPLAPSCLSVNTTRRVAPGTVESPPVADAAATSGVATGGTAPVVAASAGATNPGTCGACATGRTTVLEVAGATWASVPIGMNKASSNATTPPVTARPDTEPPACAAAAGATRPPLRGVPPPPCVGCGAGRRSRGRNRPRMEISTRHRLASGLSSG